MNIYITGFYVLLTYKAAMADATYNLNLSNLQLDLIAYPKYKGK